MLAPIYLPPQRRALKRPGAKVKGERYQRVELTVRKGYRDQPQDCSLSDFNVLAQKLSGLGLRNARCELILFMHQHYMAVADGRVAGRANVDGGAEAFKPFDQV